MPIGPAPYFRAVAAGLATGMRGSSAATMLTVAAHTGNFPLANPTLARFAGKRWLVALALLGAAGELIGDKLPMTPSRLEPGGLGARLVMGAATGAVVASSRGGLALAGALIGSAAAAASTYSCCLGRARLGKAAGVPDPLMAVGEDGLAITLAAISAGPWAKLAPPAD